MPIDIDSESLVQFAAASKLCPGHPHIATLHRWRLRGVHGVKLETILVGGKRFTSKEAISRFVAAVSAAGNGEPAPTLAANAKRRRASAEAVCRRAEI